ncbi:hypothetical protein CS542_03250 [Pedobacter sp. IW39]|nr:hypothetical protein CS542_03250 [Pedobacter sp. IW39]
MLPLLFAALIFFSLCGRIRAKPFFFQNTRLSNNMKTKDWIAMKSISRLRVVAVVSSACPKELSVEPDCGRFPKPKLFVDHMLQDEKFLNFSSNLL